MDIKRLIIHPFLFGIFPILFFYYHNFSKAESARAVVIPIIVVISAIIVVLGLFRLILKSWLKSGLAVSLLVFLFFSYGHVHNLLGEFNLIKNGWIALGTDKVLTLVSAVIALLGIYFISKIEKNLRQVSRHLNVFSMILVAISLAGIVFNHVESKDKHWETETEYKRKGTSSLNRSSLPNIYYIVLDAFAREDVLEEKYSFDNSEFLDALEDRGFFIADRSTSNYCMSVLSTSSSLNFRYLDDIAEKVGRKSKNRKPLGEMINNNKVCKILKPYGYKTVAFNASGISLCTFRNADIFYKAPGYYIDYFTNGLINTTMIPAFMTVLNRTLGFSVSHQYSMHRNKILYVFDKIEEISTHLSFSPLFIYAHVIAPHQPFVFNSEGEPVTPDTNKFLIWYNVEKGRDRNEYIEGYCNQLSFISKRVIQMIDVVLSNSRVPPIIVLQSDHGPALGLFEESCEKTDMKERMSILNAYYLPGKDTETLYSSITPVNSFRVIMNQYFNTDFQLLEDRSFFSTWSHPYDFTDVTERVK